MKALQIAAAAAAVLAGSAGLASAQAQPAPAAPERSIVKVAGDLYRFQNNQHYGVFLVTPAGVLVADPLNPDTAAWLAGEVAARFDQARVTTVVYSHHHGDHAAGAAAFPQAQVLGRPETVSALTEPTAAEGLGRRAAADRNGDGLLQRTEVEFPLDMLFAVYDQNGDGGLSPREIFQGETKDVKAPTEVWTTPVHSLTLGGKTVELHHVGGSHAEDMAYLYFPAEKALFVVDVISPNRLPTILSDYDEAERFAQIDKALSFDADYVVGGHGRIGTEADIEAQRRYLTQLRQAVQAAIDAGKTLEQTQAEVKMEAYADWTGYGDRIGPNVAGMYAYLKR